MRAVRRASAVEVQVDEVEAGLLGALAQDLLRLLGPGDEPGADPLAALVGISAGPLATPDDPALARLLPDAYPDDDDASADFRRYTEPDLRAAKRAQAEDVIASLAPYAGGGRVRLDRAGVDAWVGMVNDVRLVLGTRLEVTEEMDVDDLDPDPDDPRTQALHVYRWLSVVQESLLECLLRRPLA